MADLTSCDNAHCKFNNEYNCTYNGYIQLDENASCAMANYEEDKKSVQERKDKVENFQKNEIDKTKEEWLKYI